MPKRMTPEEKAARQQMRDAKTSEVRAAERMARKFSTDSFANFAQNIGIGSDNPMTTSTYGFNPITRVRILLEWIYRGSWIGGLVIDSVADDMTREGIELGSTLEPDDAEEMHRSMILH